MNIEANKVNRVLPRRGHVYSLNQIINFLSLEDSAHLGFIYKGRRTVIQTSHCTEEQLLSVPGIANTEWKYVRTTDEWIPVFDAVNNEAVVNCVDIETEYDFDGSATEGLWVTPKGFKREQYNAPINTRSKNNNIFVYSSYWQCWSRILQEGTVHNNGCHIEVNLTAINPTRQSSWDEQVLPMKIRKHRTARAAGDKFVGILPQHVLNDMHTFLPNDVVERLLHEDFLPNINWIKYQEVDNGGAAFELIKN